MYINSIPNTIENDIYNTEAFFFFFFSFDGFSRGMFMVQSVKHILFSHENLSQVRKKNVGYP